MPEHTHKQLVTIGIALLTFFLTIGVFALGFVAGVKLTEKRAMWSAHQEFLPFPPDSLGADAPSPRGDGPAGAHRFAINGTIQSIGSGSMLLMEGTSVRKVDITSKTRVREGKNPKDITDLVSGARVNILGRQTPEHEFEAMMVMMRK